MLYFQVACAQKFETKNDFFLCWQQIWNVVINLQKFEKKMIGSKYRRATPEFPVFYICAV